MRWQLAPVTLLVLLIAGYRFPSSSFAQQLEEPPAPPPVIESPAPPQPNHEGFLPEFTKKETDDAALMLGELRGHVRMFPDDAAGRLKLAEGLYRIGDLEAAIEECRIALTLKPGTAKARLQLGVALMAKQDWRAAATELEEAIRLDPELTQAHYNLGTAHYTAGHLKAAIQSYERALDLQGYFPDARYRLALVLKLAHRDRESAQRMEEAALGGVPQAQYFLGNAYRTGQDVEKNGALAVTWLVRAARLGHQPAVAALSQLRRQALSPNRSDKKRREAFDAFQGYRDKLWDGFPDVTRNGGDTLGATLLKQDRADEAIPILLAESYALSDAAQAELAGIYERGWGERYPAFDKTIFSCFETTAGEGFTPAKKILARIYAKGLGIAEDRQKARDLLKGLPKPEIEAVLNESAPHP